METLADSHASERARLSRFLHLVFRVAAMFALGELLMAWWLGSYRLIGTGLLMVITCIVMAVAQRSLQANREQVTVQAIAMWLLVVALLCAPLMPFSTAALALVPLIAFAISLPWLSGFPLNRMALLCVITEVGIALLSWFLPSNPPTTWERILAAVSFVAAAVLILAQLAQYAERQGQSITALKQLAQLQSRMTAAERMSSVGSLAAGVAHDFNNLLTLVMGHAQSLVQDVGAGGSAAAKLALITGATARAADLTSQLLAFGRQQVLQPEVVSLNDLSQALAPLLRSVLGEKIALSFELAPVLDDTFVDPSQIERVIVNLVMNARDAMPQGGRLLIKTERVEVEAALVEGVALPPGAYVALSVSDTGLGMDAQTQARLFEPFFTTKPVGAGTGLGLATAYGIIKQSGGEISVHSAPERGSRFTLYLPRTLIKRLEVTPRLEPKADVPAGETILVVEDNTDLQDLVEQALVMRGYHVLRASDGEKALQVCEHHPGPIHLVLTDIVMRDIGGIELTAGIRRLRPTLPILYMSGHPSRSFGQLAELINPRNFLQKPFSLDVLYAKIRDSLPAKPILS